MTSIWGTAKENFDTLILKTGVSFRNNEMIMFVLKY